MKRMWKKVAALAAVGAIVACHGSNADGTSFRGELDAARVRVAQRLLLDSSEAIARVAIEVGCSSPQQLSGLFRRVVGESPREWRARVRSLAIGYAFDPFIRQDHATRLFRRHARRCVDCRG